MLSLIMLQLFERTMLSEALDFVKEYIDLLNQSLNAVGGRLTGAQKAWERWSGGNTTRWGN